MPNRQQAIIWHKVGIFYWHIYASLSLNELNFHLCIDYTYVLKYGQTILSKFHRDSIYFVYTWITYAIKVQFKFSFYQPAMPFKQDFVWIQTSFLHQTGRDWGQFKKHLLCLRALKILALYEIHISQYVGMIFCLEFQRAPLKFHTKIFYP